VLRERRITPVDTQRRHSITGGAEGKQGVVTYSLLVRDDADAMDCAARMEGGANTLLMTTTPHRTCRLSYRIRQ
jgi:hypothetical protein